MLKRLLTGGMLPAILLGMSIAAPASAECNNPIAPCGSGSGSGSSRAMAVSYDSPYYGFTVGVYGAVNLPFLSNDVADLSIDPPLPSGLLFNSATGGITGTPTTTTEGVTPFVIQGCNDQKTQCTSTVIRLSVNPARAPRTAAPSPTPVATPTMTPTPSVTPSPTPRPVTSPSPSPSATPSALR